MRECFIFYFLSWSLVLSLQWNAALGGEPHCPYKTKLPSFTIKIIYCQKSLKPKVLNTHQNPFNTTMVAAVAITVHGRPK